MVVIARWPIALFLFFVLPPIVSGRTEVACMAQRDAQAGAFRPVLAVLGGLALVLQAGCVSPVDDRAKLFNDDGVHLFAQGDYANALDSFDLALTLRPQDATLLFNMAECYNRLGDTQRAEKFYGATLVQAPKHADARLALVELLYRAGRQPQADQLIDEWARQEPQSSDVYVLDAWRRLQVRDYPAAEGRLQQALDIDPHNRRALAEFARLYEQMGMPQRAYVLYERILTREPEQSQIAQRLDRLKVQGVSRPLPD
jgi:Tfp pilus assembly protein PilF